MTSRNRLISLLAGASALAVMGVTAVSSQVVTGTQDFTITVQEGADSTPDAFTLGGYNAPVGNIVTLGPVPLTGFDDGTAISVSGAGAPEYSLDGGVTFTSSAGTVNSGDQVYLRVTASDSANQNRVANLTVGDVTETFTVSTSSAQAEEFVTAFSSGGRLTSDQWSWKEASADISAYIGKTGRFLVKYDRTGTIYGDLQLDNVTLGTQTWDFSTVAQAQQWDRQNTTSGRSSYNSVSWQSVPSSNGVAPGYWGWKSTNGTPTGNTGVSSGWGGQVFAETSLSGATGASGTTWLRSPETLISSGDFYFNYGAYGSGLGTLTVFLYLPQKGTPLTTSYPVTAEPPPPPPSLDLVDTFTAYNNSVASVPAHEAGDLFVAFAFDSGRLAGVPSNASGWTSLDTQTRGADPSMAARVSYWVAPSSCASSCSFPAGDFGSNVDQVFYAVYRNAGVPIVTSSSGSNTYLDYTANAAEPDNARTLVVVGITDDGLYPDEPTGMTVVEGVSGGVVSGTVRMFESDVGPAFSAFRYSWGYYNTSGPHFVTFTARIPRE